jgi:hypothetical protein
MFILGILCVGLHYGMWLTLTPDAQYVLISVAQIIGTGLGMCFIFLPKLLNLNIELSTTGDTTASSRQAMPKNTSSGGSGADTDNPSYNQFKKENATLKKEVERLQKELGTVAGDTATGLLGTGKDRGSKTRAPSLFTAMAAMPASKRESTNVDGALDGVEMTSAGGVGTVAEGDGSTEGDSSKNVIIKAPRGIVKGV